MSNLAQRYVPYTTGMDNDVSEVTIPLPMPPPPAPPPSMPPAFAQPSLTGFNYRRDPALMMAPLDDAPAPTTQVAPAGSLASVTVHTTEASSAVHSSSPPAPMAVPYIALHNVGWKATNFTGRKWVILPMVAGFESTFIANTLQGLLCLPGCESAMMGDPTPTSTTTTTTAAATDASMTADGTPGLTKELSSTQLRFTRAQPTAWSAPAATSPSPATAAAEEDEEELDDAEPQEEEDTEYNDDDDELCHDETAALSGGEQSEDAADDAHHSGVSNSGNRSRGGNAMPVLRGGIRCQWGRRVKTAASQTYTSYVMQNLSDAGIQLRRPAPRAELIVDAAVPFSKVDDAEELESLRGQSAVVPHSLAPVALPTAPKSPATATTTRGRGHVAVYLAHPDDTAGPTLSGARVATAGRSQAGGGSSGPPSSAAAGPSSSSVAPASPAMSAGTVGTIDVANAARAGSPTTAAAALQHIRKAAAVQLVTSEGHSSDDNNSPTPSSREEEEEEEEEEAVWVSADAAERTSAATARMAHHPVATDASRYTCLASNCVDNMPNYPLPQLQSEDLVDLASFMVARSTLQPDEAVDLQLGTHVLGDPRALQHLPAEQRAALMQRAARLMEAAVFLQV